MAIGGFVMELDSFERMQSSWLYRFFDLLSKLILVNLCIILFSLCGLVVFGFFPALYAATAYFNDVLEGREGKMFPRMFGYFKKYFWIGNLQMLITVPTVVLGFYLIYGREFGTFVYLILFSWIIISMVLGWYMPVVNVLYPEFKTGKKILFSIVASCDRFILTIIFLVLDLAWMYAVLLIPQLMLFIVFSTPVWFGTWRIKKALKPDSIFDPEKEEIEENDDNNN